MFYISRVLFLSLLLSPFSGLANSKEIVHYKYQVEQKNLMDFEGLHTAENSFYPFDLTFKDVTTANGAVVFKAEFDGGLSINRSAVDKDDIGVREASIINFTLPARSISDFVIEFVTGKKSEGPSSVAATNQRIERFYNTRPNRLAQVTYETLAAGIPANTYSMSCLPQAQKRHLDLAACALTVTIYNEPQETVPSITIEVFATDKDGQEKQISKSFATKVTRY